MQFLSDNPYRVLGVLAGATAREISRQANTIKKFLAAGEELPCDYAFPVFGNLVRDAVSVDTAMAKLNLDADKITAALFWFSKGNASDESAFDALKAGNIDLALQIWDSLIFTETKNDGYKYWKPVSIKNYAAFHNYFVISLLNNNTNISNAIVAQLKFLESNFCLSFTAKVTDRTLKTTSNELQLLFLNEILREIEQETIRISFAKLVSILNNNQFVKEDFLKNISKKLTEKITSAIETTHKNTKDKANVAKAGETLFEQTKDDMEQLKIIFGIQDFTYFNTADKLANEILQCGIDHFEHFKDTKTNPYEHSIKLYDWANSLAVGYLTKQCCRENIIGIQQWNRKNNRNFYRIFSQWINTSQFFNNDK